MLMAIKELHLNCNLTWTWEEWLETWQLWLKQQNETQNWTSKEHQWPCVCTTSWRWNGGKKSLVQLHFSFWLTLPWQPATVQTEISLTLCCSTNVLFELVHQFVPLPLEGQHLLLGLLFIGGWQFQQGNISIFLTDGCQQSLLPEEEKNIIFIIL